MSNPGAPAAAAAWSQALPVPLGCLGNWLPQSWPCAPNKVVVEAQWGHVSKAG